MHMSLKITGRTVASCARVVPVGQLSISIALNRPIEAQEATACGFVQAGRTGDYLASVLAASRAAAWAACRPGSGSSTARFGRNVICVTSVIPAQRSQSLK
jgi:phage terminase large subunit-like protein